MNVHGLPHDDLTRLREVASANGWTEVAYDAREELQRRVCDRGNA